MKTIPQRIGTIAPELHSCGYGPRHIVDFPGRKPEFRNLGYNVFHADDFQCCEIVGELRRELSDIPDMLDRWQGWIHARFENGATPVFIYPHRDTWDTTTKTYVGNIYTVNG